MSSFFSSAGRRLGVIIYGDDRRLQKTLAKSEASLTKFGRKTNAISSGLLRGGGLGGIIGGAAIGLGIEKMVSAAEKAQVVLGQTEKAVENAGLSWEKNADRIQAAALKISKGSGFDDEAIMQSFSVFVRGQKDVAKSLELSALAADVARGRNISLESATMLVTKAAMGQVGALRRVGIDIKKNATATEALTKLTQAYGGAAEKYSKSAQGATDRLKVSIENLAESAGQDATPAIEKLADAGARLADMLSGAASSADNMAASLTDPRIAAALTALNGIQKGVALANALGATQTPAPGEGRMPGAGVGSTQAGGLQSLAKTIPGLVTGVSARLEDNLLNARISGNDQAIKKALQAEGAYIEKALGQSRLNRAQRTDLKQALIGINDEIRSIDAAAAAAAKSAADQTKRAANDAQQAAEASARRQREAREKAREAARKAAAADKKATDALKKQGKDLLDAARARLDAVQSKRDTARDLADAKSELRLAKLIGGPRGILEAQRHIQDATLARKRQMLDSASITVNRAAGPGGNIHPSGYTVHIGQLTLNGVTNVKQLLAELQKASKRTTASRRGRHGGNNTHLG